MCDAGSILRLFYFAGIEDFISFILFFLDTTYQTISDADANTTRTMGGEKSALPPPASSHALATKQGGNCRQTHSKHSIYDSDSEEGNCSNSPPPLPPRLYLTDDDDDKNCANQLPVNNTASTESTSHSSSSPPPLPPRLYADDDEVLFSLSLVMEPDSNGVEYSSGVPPPLPPRLYLDDDKEFTHRLPDTNEEYTEDTYMYSSSCPPPPIPPRMYLHDKDFISNHLEGINLGVSSLTRISKPPAMERDDEANLRRCVSDPPPAFLAQRVLETQAFPHQKVPGRFRKPDLRKPVQAHSVFASKEYFEESLHGSSPPHSSFSNPHVHISSVDRSPPPLPSKKSLSEQLLMPASMNHLSPLGAWSNLKSDGYGCDHINLSRSMPSISTQSCLSDEEVLTHRKLAKNVIVPPATVPKPSVQFVSSMEERFPPRLPPKPPFLGEVFHKATSGDQLSHPKTLAVFNSNIHRTNSSNCPRQTLVGQQQEELTKNCLRPLPPLPFTRDQQDVGNSQKERRWRPLSAYSPSAIKRKSVDESDFSGVPYSHAAPSADKEETTRVRRCSSFTPATYSLVGPSSPPGVHTQLPTSLAASFSGVGSLERTGVKGSSHNSNIGESQYSLLGVPPPLPKKSERRLLGFMDNKRAFFGRAIHKKKSDSTVQHGLSKSCQLQPDKKSAVPFGDKLFTRFFRQGVQEDDAKNHYDKLCHMTNVQGENETLHSDIQETGYHHLTWSNQNPQHCLSETAFTHSSAGNITHTQTHTLT